MKILRIGIGEQNIKNVMHLLEQEGIPLKGRDTGGSHGRSVEFHLETGRVVVKAFEKDENEYNAVIAKTNPLSAAIIQGEI